MNADVAADAEAFRRTYPWLTDWFQRPNATLFDDAAGRSIAEELGRRWGAEHPLAVLDELRGRFGPTVAEVVRAIVHENARRDWAEIGKGRPGRTIDDLLQLLWEPLRGAGFEFTIEKRSDGVQFRCTSCPHVAAARAAGGADWMGLLLCGADPGMVAGFNPAIGFRRTKTLLEGHDCCDHFYFLKPTGRD